MVTVRSIAQAAGVSRGTVDRVLHERGSVNPEVALRVRALSRELGYVPPRGGRSGESGHGKFRIGVLVPSIGNLFFDEVLEGVYQGSAEFADIEIEVRKLQGFEPDDHVRAIRELLEAGCQAMCLTTVSDDKVRAVLEELSQKGIRVVLMNTCVEKVPAVCYVGSDYRKSGRTCAGMLAMMQPPKPVRLLVAVGSRKVPGHMQRLEGFMEEIKRLGVPCEVSAVVETGDSDIRGQQVTTESLAADSSINCVYVTGAGIQGVGAALILLTLQQVRVIFFQARQLMLTAKKLQVL